MRYTELQVTSNFSFLRGASHPEELVEQAATFGYESIAITDCNTFAGIVRAHVAAKNFGIRIIPACRLDLIDGPSLLAYPTNQKAYSRLSSLLTLGNRRAEKGQCHLYKADVYQHVEGSKLVIVPPLELNEVFDFDESFKKSLREYHDAFGHNLYLGASRAYNGNDGKLLFRIHQLSEQLHVPMVATNDVHYHHPLRRELQDVVTCVREKCTIYNAVFQFAQAKRACISNLLGIANGIRILTKQAFHFIRRFQIPFGIGVQPVTCIMYCALFTYAGNNILQFPP